MLINIILLICGIVLLIYGIRNKTKFFTIAGVVILFLGLISIGMDIGMGTGGVDNHRLPFIVGGMTK